MKRYELAKTGWWDDGIFHMPLYEVRDDGKQYPTAYHVDYSASSNVAAKFVRDAVADVNVIGLEAAVAKYPRLFLKIR